MQGFTEADADRQERGSAAAVIDLLGFPAAIVDQARRIVHGNRLFADFLATASGARIWQRLDIGRPPVEVVRLILEAGDGIAGPRILGLRTLAGGDPRTYLVTVSAAGHSDPAMRRHPCLEGDITPAEQAVLLALLDGRPLSAVAQARGTKVTTVRWHLKNLQWKLGMTDKAEVVAWIARSPVCWLAREPDSRSDA